MSLVHESFQPDFEYLVRTLNREKTDRPVLFEFLVDLGICSEVVPGLREQQPGSVGYFKRIIEAFKKLGYDYAPVYTWETDIFSFPKGDYDTLASRSQNEGALITDQKSFDAYPWPDVQKSNFDIYQQLAPHLPDGMKLVGFSNGGILENATEITGYQKLCEIYLLDPDLCHQLFEHIGSRLLDFYTTLSSIDSVGACVVNDDWGFKTQTMFPPEMMREYVFPYTGKIVEAIHSHGKQAILHSCGNLKGLMDVIIDELKLDGKHSFEDEIYPVEDAIDWWLDRIAIMGGMDMDFLSRRSPEEIYDRSIRLLELTFDRGGYALGSGNSIPAFVPLENYQAMLKAARDFL
jgi:uroporphyrinogen decarboxylase